jgi:MFS family permease
MGVRPSWNNATPTVDEGKPAMSTRPGDYPGFRQLWISTTVSDFGTYVTTVALQVLVVTDLHASATEVGIVNAARWVPYLLFGMLAGVYVDRRRRRPVLVGSDLGRAVLLGAIPVLAACHQLSIPVVAALLIPFGLLSLVNDAADQSFVPRVIGPAALNNANARLQQSSSASQTAGPLLAGGLVAAIGAPLSVLVDAVSYLVSGLIVGTISTVEQVPVATTRHVWTELKEGVAWVYRHRMMAPMAITTHIWFVFNSMLNTVFVLFALDEARIGAFGLGIAYACSGVGGVVGTGLSNRAARWWGAGPAVVVAQFLFPVAFVLVVLAPHGVVAVVLIAAGMSVFGFAVGLGSPIELTYRQSVTPDRLQGRMNATIRSLNWGLVAVGAPVGGVIADALGYRAALWIGIVGVALAAVALLASPFRRADLADRVPGPAEPAAA